MILGLYCEAKRNATVVTINLNGQCEWGGWLYYNNRTCPGFRKWPVVVITKGCRNISKATESLPENWV